MADDSETSRDDACRFVVGAGCRGPGPEASACDTADTDTAADTGEAEVAVVGRGCACDGVAAPAAWPWLVLLFVALRRAPWALLLLIAPAARAGVDAQAVHPQDGGEFVALHEADLGPRWSLAAAWSYTGVREPVLLVDASGERVLLEQAITRELGASVNLGGIARLGLAMPRHRAVRYDGEAYDKVAGDFAAWLAIPLTERSRDVDLAWTVQLAFPTGTPDLYLGDPSGAIRGRLTADVPAGPFRAGLEAAIALRNVVDAPGVAWNSRLEWGAGVRRSFGRFEATTELFGSTPTRLTGGPGDFPIETLASAGFVIVPGVTARVAGGGGLSRGLGSPSARGVALIEARQRDQPDTDADGVIDARDRCVVVPEDDDLWQDDDGCPDRDNDQDGLADGEDACPNRAEVRNDWLDDDGCPDAATRLVLRVFPESGFFETATVRLGDDVESVFANDTIERTFPEGVVEVEITADGFHPWRGAVALSGERVERRVGLVPVRFGDVELRVTDAAGRPLAAVLIVDGAPADVPAGGATFRLPAGDRVLRVDAVAHVGRDVPITLDADEHERVTVALDPAVVRIAGGAVEIRDEIRFETGADVLDPASLAVVDELAALLAADPRVRLLRVEGHASETGDSAANYALSARRAEAVRARLIDRGIAADRLVAIGTGEARVRGGGEDAASRRVTFTVLVWDDTRPRPREPDAAAGE